MNVLVVTNDFPPRVGGVNGYVAELMRRFPPGDVTVLAADWPGAASFDTRYPQRVVRWPARGMYPTAPVRDRVEELVRETRADIVLFGAAAPLALMGRAIQKRTGVPYATFTHGVEVWAGQFPVTRGLLGSVTRGAALTMAVSEWAMQQLRQVVGPEPWIELVPPGVDQTWFHPGVPDAEVRARHGLDGDPVVSCVARLTLRKGQDKVIRAMPWILREIPEARFLVVGSGPDRDRLEGLANRKRVADRVVFAGEVPYEVLPQYFRAGDVFAMPCRTRRGGMDVEGLGIVYLEASATGLPVVAGDSGGAPEAVVEGETGWVVPGRSVTAVAARVSALLADPAAARAAGKKGRAWVEREWRWDGLADRLGRLLQE